MGLESRCPAHLRLIYAGIDSFCDGTAEKNPELGVKDRPQYFPFWKLASKKAEEAGHLPSPSPAEIRL